jgi:hypothetical protein
VHTRTQSLEFQLEYGRSACFEQPETGGLEVYANAAASIGGGEVGVMLEKVGSRTLGSGKTRSLCMPNHRQLKGQKSTT